VLLNSTLWLVGPGKTIMCIFHAYIALFRNLM
jgi:hypothetical protein